MTINRTLLKNLLFVLWTVFSIASGSAQVPKIVSVKPELGAVGTQITITGSGFSPVANENIVYFGGVKAVVIASSESALSVIVPTGATLSPITITINGLTAYSPRQFRLTFPTAGLFGAPIDFTTGYNPITTAIGDIDGDGKCDIVTSNNGSNSISILRNTSNPGNISFDSKFDLGSGRNTADVTIADINGDGRLDILSVNPNDLTVSIFINSSSPGSLSLLKQNITVSASATVVRAVDLDQDGKLDIALAIGSYENRLIILPNTTSNGLLSFGPEVRLSTVGNSESLEVGDLNGDSKTDIITVAPGANLFSVFPNLSTPGNFVFGARIDVATRIPYRGAIADMDNDSKPDFCVNCTRPDYNVSIFLNNSNPNVSFAPAVDSSLPVSVDCTVAGELNGDGIPDLALAAPELSQVLVKMNNSSPGNISLSQTQSFKSGQWPHFVAIADIDGDKRNDIVSVSRAANTVSVLINKLVQCTTNNWSGSQTSEWENPENWSCGKVPDSNSDVVIGTGSTVVVNSNVIVNSLKIEPGSNLTVGSGYQLTVLH